MGLWDQVTKILGSNGSTTAAVTTRGSKGAVAVEILDASGAQVTGFPTSLVPFSYDYVSITYNSSSNPTEVVYKTGGSGGTTVATLTIAYTGSNPVSITRT